MERDTFSNPESFLSQKIKGEPFYLHSTLLGAAYPKALSLESTNFCNLSCSHCKRSSVNEFTRGHFDMRLLEKLQHLIGTVIPGVSLSDYGEPLLSKVWPELLSWALSRDTVQISFTTNGLLLDRHLDEVINPRISIGVSIDGATEKTYGYFRGKGHFSKLIENLRMLKKLKGELGVAYPVVSIYFAVSQVNCHELADMVELAAELGSPLLVVQFQLFFDRKKFEAESVYFRREAYDEHIAKARQLAAKLGVVLIHPDSFDGQSVIPRDSIENLWLGKNPDGSVMCHAQRSTTYVKYDGLVGACCASSHLIMGDLAIDSFEDIWHGASYRALRLAFDQGVWPSVCSHCNLIQSIDSKDERSHYVSLDGVPPEGKSVRQRYRVTELELIYQEAVSLINDPGRALDVLTPLLDLDDNLYEATNLAAYLYGIKGDVRKMRELLEKCHRIAPRDEIIERNVAAVAGIAGTVPSGGPIELEQGAPAFEVEDLTKTYRLYDSPSARLKELFLRRRFHREFTALDRVSFSVKKGETLGIIGENGAGKSTLLKIISRTLKPTSGRISVDGRISSLLELGSGFHPEFTGMENIFFYGSLLGMTTADMKQKVDEIIAFAEIGEHINYPLKTYSSGMYVRLAFSVATAIDPHILVVDEALSVGDLYFQKKSAEKILSFKEQGKTILFCSHSMYFINRLCDRVLWLRDGKMFMEGHPHDVTQAFETFELKKNAVSDRQENMEQPAGQRASALVLIRSVLITPYPIVEAGSDLRIEIEIEVNDADITYMVAAVLKRIDGMDIIGIGTKDYEPLRGNRLATLTFPSLPLKEGTFYVEAYAMDEQFVHIYDMKASVPFTIPKETVELGFLSIPYKWTL